MTRKKSSNKDIAQIFSRIADLEEINGVAYKPAAYRKAAAVLESLEEDISALYASKGIKGIMAIPKIGKSMAGKIEELFKKGKISSYEELKEKTALREIVTHFFQTKGIPLTRLKMAARKQRIIYSRYVAPAKQLLELAGSVEKTKEANSKVAAWANSPHFKYIIL